MLFAVAWGAGQFAPMLLVYRGELGFSTGHVSALFGLYALGLAPGLLLGGRLSDRLGRRTVVLPFVVLSPLTSVLLMLGRDAEELLVAGRLLAGASSGVVFGACGAWVQELSADAPAGAGARRAAVAMSCGFGLSALAAGAIGQWAPAPLWAPYVPHVVLGAIAALLGLGVRETLSVRARGRLLALPRAVRTPRFALVVAPMAPWVFGAATISGVVLPQLVGAGARLGVAFAGLVNAITLVTGVAIQPLARALEARRALLAGLAGLALVGAGLAVGLVALAAGSVELAVAAGLPLGAAYGMLLVSGLREAERLASPDERGAMIAVYLLLTYVGFALPYAVAGIEGAVGAAGALWLVAAVLAACAAVALAAARRVL